MKHYRLIAALAVSLGILPVAGAADAPQSGLGLNVSPAKLELSMSPGASYNIPVSIQNNSGATTHIQASMVDFGVTPNGDYEFAHVGARPFSMMRWASINPREFDLPTSTTQQVRLSLAVPQGSDLNGEYAGIVFFQTRAVRRAGAVAFSVRIATKIYLTIPGTVKIDGAITKMTASSGGGGEAYRVMFKNLGNAHTYLRGEIQVQRDGATVDRISMPDNMLVERGGERLIEVSGKSLPTGKYQAVALVDYGGKTMTGGQIAFEKR
ncbi:MAG: hypothetical protein ACXWNK_11395 [Vulcanimicrobiaceae bacterium]